MADELFRGSKLKVERANRRSQLRQGVSRNRPAPCFLSVHPRDRMPVRSARRGPGRRPALSFGPWRRRITPFPRHRSGEHGNWPGHRAPTRQVRAFVSTTAGIPARFESL